MTRIEKETTMRALRQYADTCSKEAECEMERGEFETAAKLQAEANIANASLSVFAILLAVPCGEARI